MIRPNPIQICRIAILIITLAITLSGCMSASNLSDIIKWRNADEHNCWRLKIEGTPPIVYGGVWSDVKLIGAPITYYETVVFPAFPFIMIFGIVDFAPSLILDTLALPYTIPYAVSLNCK